MHTTLKNEWKPNNTNKKGSPDEAWESMATQHIGVTVVHKLTWHHHVILMLRKMKFSLIRENEHTFRPLRLQIKLETTRAASLTITTRCSQPSLYIMLMYWLHFKMSIYISFTYICFSLGFILQLLIGQAVGWVSLLQVWSFYSERHS